MHACGSGGAGGGREKQERGPCGRACAGNWAAWAHRQALLGWAYGRWRPDSSLRNLSELLVSHYKRLQFLVSHWKSSADFSDTAPTFFCPPCHIPWFFYLSLHTWWSKFMIMPRNAGWSSRTKDHLANSSCSSASINRWCWFQCDALFSRILWGKQIWTAP